MPEQLGLEREPNEQVTTKVIFEFFRHGEKEKAEKPENEVRLTEKGRQMATDRGQELNPQPEVSVGFGSLRKRSLETAGRVMLATTGAVEPEMPLEEIESLISQELKVGKKIVADDRLDFQQDRTSEFGQKHLAAFKAGKIMEFMINDSDRLAKELNDPRAFSYSRVAANVAEILQKYLQVGNNFERVAEANPEKYRQFHNQLERYFGTHQTVGESFMAKLLEVSVGENDRDHYLSKVPPSGVAELQGFRVEIVNKGNTQTAALYAKAGGEEWEIPITAEILQKIIQERN